ncbi:MAG TPA: helix-hairpin-helix domain-containing protein [Thermodesulfobacteriota bacterium]|nr:helix-hairpin-helix domain-containing protein [Deltaproteobacteria bacterium]HNU71998.1 helix-hairpin-helix domain-containing protein [Thermodesulfobacteriota bacterium]HOC39338.1 helix-hairpin-helix domain-containing protein [Thermodesulfobacteriota bacterium]
MNRSQSSNSAGYSSLSPGIVLSIAAALLSLALYRDVGAHLESRTLIPEKQPAVIIELAGAIEKPGVYFLSSPPAAAEVLAVAGEEGDACVVPVANKNIGWRVPTGTRLVIETQTSTSARRMVAEPMAAAGKVAFGLPLDLNAVTAEDLEVLPDIGPHTAAAIIADRAARGRYSAVTELQQVKGIGPKKFQRLSQYLSVESTDD